MGNTKHFAIVMTQQYKVDTRSKDRKGEMKAAYREVREITYILRLCFIDLAHTLINSWEIVYSFIFRN